MILIYIVSYDIWFYVSHIMLHYPFIYKHIHNIHHRINYKTMQYPETYVGHWLESVVQGLGILFPLLFITFYLDVFLYLLLLINIRGMMRHDTRFVWMIGNHHLLHHKYPNYNFGEYWLDKIGGTVYPNKQEYEYGLIYL